MKKYSSSQVLEYIIEAITTNLNELYSDEEAIEDEEFLCGLKYAYVEVLEMMLRWKYAKRHPVFANLEETFPLTWRWNFKLYNYIITPKKQHFRFSGFFDINSVCILINAVI